MSAQKKPILTITRSATGAITAHRAVTLAGTVAATGAAAVGFSVADAAIGESFAVDVIGTSIGIAGAAIAAGAALQVGTNGHVITQTTGNRIGFALFAAGTGAPVEVFIDKAPAPAG